MKEEGLRGAGKVGVGAEMEYVLDLPTEEEGGEGSCWLFDVEFLCDEL